MRCTGPLTGRRQRRNECFHNSASVLYERNKRYALEAGMGVKIPDHWHDISWEEKAKENPLFAVMTTEDVADADAENFDEKHLAPFMAKGERVYTKDVEPVLRRISGAKENIVVAEYGCGVGRVLKPVYEAGYQTFGIDISETMLKHCRDLAPGVKDLYLLKPDGSSDAADASADMVFSFAVVKHISALSNYLKAIDEMCRILKPGGYLALNVNCEDFQHGDIDTPWRTENFESYSLHYRPGETKPYRRHDQDNWTGVYIGHDKLIELLAERGVAVERRYYQNMKKLRGIWYVGSKAA
jgi:SAM-dependent methyltransferase